MLLFLPQDFRGSNLEQNTYNLHLAINGDTWHNISMWHTVTQSTSIKILFSQRTNRRYNSSISDSLHNWTIRRLCYLNKNEQFVWIYQEGLKFFFFNLKTKKLLNFWCGPLTGEGGGDKALTVKIRCVDPKPFVEVALMRFYWTYHHRIFYSLIL